jgi:hypothetical protein
VFVQLFAIVYIAHSSYNLTTAPEQQALNCTAGQPALKWQIKKSKKIDWGPAPAPSGQGIPSLPFGLATAQPLSCKESK